ncbi:NADP-dependent oxidoreductase [Paenibacillus sp. TRM 82003]|uniref:NADP-dependent oxidoreductase n=1 Tax=Kineococcus sp. TRM81007 TaxID=2925831 RepID=UPI001F5AF8DF|nr:NADP-dependent oxidoreductase [Kineococcus sp. TRM81007]MCI2239448.1 NADP-dependent oxidoreductase [Kineococcus sp. TRM81007]MCI3918818.1 NADP-dependent oxidoreductase [Paenibacillus sp. TRM 82003]
MAVLEAGGVGSGMGRAVRFTRYGGPEVLQVVQVPRPEAQPGTVVVEVVSAAVNPGEIGIREGVFADTWPASFPEGQGNDFSGVVAEVGPGVERLGAGQAVLGFAPRAAQAQFVRVPADRLAVKPAGLGWDEAAAVAGAGATAWAAVAVVDPRPGETVLVSAAAGGVGVVAAQLALLRGARVVGTAGEGNAGFLAGLGVVPVRYGPGLLERVRAAAPDGVDACVDTFGPPNVEVALALGVPAGRINTTADGRAVQRHGVHHDAQEQADDPGIWRQLARLVADGRLQVPITATYPLAAVQRAYRDLATRHVRGKRVLHIASPARRAELVP